MPDRPLPALAFSCLSAHDVRTVRFFFVGADRQSIGVRLLHIQDRAGEIELYAEQYMGRFEPTISLYSSSQSAVKHRVPLLSSTGKGYGRARATPLRALPRNGRNARGPAQHRLAQ